MVGPDGGNHASWEKAFTKYTATADEVATAKLAPRIGTDRCCNIKAFAWRSYIPQLCTPPTKTSEIEPHAIKVTLLKPFRAISLTVATTLA